MQTCISHHHPEHVWFRCFFSWVPLSGNPTCWWTLSPPHSVPTYLCLISHLTFTQHRPADTCKSTKANCKTSSANRDTWDKLCYSTSMNPSCVWSGIMWIQDCVGKANKTRAQWAEWEGVVNFSVPRTLVKHCENCFIWVIIAIRKEEEQTSMSERVWRGKPYLCLVW